jgi:hypothetical protein
MGDGHLSGGIGAVNSHALLMRHDMDLEQGFRQLDRNLMLFTACQSIIRSVDQTVERDFLRHVNMERLLLLKEMHSSDVDQMVVLLLQLDQVVRILEDLLNFI